MEKYKKEIGKIYGCYKILDILKDETKVKKIYCKCECQKCGEIRIVGIDHVKYRNYEFCPICRPKPKLKNDIVGKKYGKLLVIERVENHIQPNGSVKVMYKCKCDCGNECIVQKHHIEKGHTTSCGCEQRRITGKAHLKNIKGNRYGLLVAEELIYINNEPFWRCKCDCGGEKITTVRRLNSKHVFSCGCIVSINEFNFEKILKGKNIKYSKQYKFKECRYKRPLPFDFAIFNNEKLACLVEIQGMQHYYPFTFCGENKDKKTLNLIKLQEKDNIKRNFCLEQKIPLLEIKYTDFDKMEIILMNFLKEINYV